MPKQETKENMRSFTDVKKRVDFHPDLPKVDKSQLIDLEVKVLGAKIIEGWSSNFGNNDFALIWIELPDESQATSLIGGIAVMKQIRTAIKEHQFPLRGTLRLRTGENNPYYEFE